jgi:hypothetical protein
MVKLFFSLPGQMLKFIFFRSDGDVKKFFTLGSAGKPLFFLFFPATQQFFKIFNIPRGENDFFNELSIIARGYNEKV